MSIVTPYNHTEGSKKEQVKAMFDNIAPRYDFLNHFLSLGIDRRWRKKAIALLQNDKPKILLDIATGTADFAIEALTLQPDSIKGIDISNEMLDIGRKKIKKINAEHKIELLPGDSEKINFEDNSFDAITAGFGVRNFENLSKGLSEIYRVLKKNGTLVILEFSTPEKFPVRQIYHAYFQNILPFIGRIVSKDNRAYSYLPESVKTFPSGKNFIKLLNETGFSNTKCIPLTFGIASIYTGKK
ncbi:MAG TPA: bifunctional demethylmenaquinone methyltransferase/2-methoxy-6-polyprenyl-1,4-benzoquinol methylase UbiE [Bacteroidia bacterium]|nr:bifunctional demethylmenaquinone methyltransferase/2-methoxy-6-polyprenyl-1,4-benzoquinol methylase UbiE [Bacteroidia bacterium]